MFVNSCEQSGSHSLTFLGKKVGRRRSVAPAGKQRAWESTDSSSVSDDTLVSSGPGRGRVSVSAAAAVQVLEDLPGSVPHLKDERTRPIIQETAGVCGRKVNERDDMPTFLRDKDTETETTRGQTRGHMVMEILRES